MSQRRNSLASTPLARSVGAYLNHSRDLFTSLLLVLPLFVAYQVGVLLTGGVRNGVDFVTDLMWWAAGGQLHTYLTFNLVVLAAFGVTLLVLRQRGSFHLRIWPWLVAESTVYAMFFGGAVIQLMGLMGLDGLLAAGSEGLANLSLVSTFVLSIGAGLYEELVFRLLLTSGLVFLAVRAFGWPAWLGAIFAVVLSSIAFSAVHHIGNMGEPFVVGVFMFRFFAGLLLAAIFYLRGFAVAVYTHAIYDVIVLTLG